MNDQTETTSGLSQPNRIGPAVAAPNQSPTSYPTEITGAGADLISARTVATPQSAPQPSGSHSAEVLTLAEAAAYLRLAETEVIQLVGTQDLPGRSIGSEWRFSKWAIEDWLRTPVSMLRARAKPAEAEARVLGACPRNK